MNYALFTSYAPQFVFLRVVIIFALTSIAAIISLHVTRKKSGKLHYLLIRKLIVIGIYIVGIVMMLDQIPMYNNIFATILTGSGIAALGISLAAQQSLSNFISGMVISASKPFEVGDRVHLINGNITGNIEDITLRHTVVRTFMNSRVIIPNSVMNSDLIENSNIVEERASSFLDVIITYDSDIDKAMEIMVREISAHPNFVDVRTPEEMDKPIVVVLVRNLGLHGVELRSSVWTGSIFNSFITCSEIRRKIKLAFDSEGIKFAVAQTAALTPD